MSECKRKDVRYSGTKSTEEVQTCRTYWKGHLLSRFVSELCEEKNRKSR